jgi:hypothetical protein
MHPEWELDTRHAGFASAEEAAFAANGLGIDGFEELRLELGELFVVDVNGRRTRVREDVTVWFLVPVATSLPEDFRFERSNAPLGELSRRGLDGGFDARRFRVLDEGRGADVDVRLVVGRSKVVALVGHAQRTPSLSIPSA